MNDKDTLRDTFQTAGRRLTSQRRLVLDVLRASNEHIDAETIYARARTRDPDIGLATIYRTLAVLKEMGLVEEHRLGEEHGHYEAKSEPHYHFTCLGCGKVIEFDTPLMEQIQRKLSEQEGVSITSAHLHLSGYCAECQNKTGGQHSNEK